MKKTYLGIITALSLIGLQLGAQANDANKPKGPSTPAAATTDSTTAKTPAPSPVTAPPIEIQHLRPFDQRGLNVFEPPKKDAVPYTGFKLSWGGAFTQQYQNLDHSNSADSKLVSGVNQNQLVRIGGGPNNADANLYLNAQLAPGIRIAMTSYLSARHHNESWVKDGYLLIDESPIKVKALETLMKYVTIRAGHFEINYGDAHFRRTDNGNAMFNPLVGNYIMDAFTTEIGGEVYIRTGPWLAMGGVVAGESKGMVQKPEQRAPAYLSKFGLDKKLSDLLRVRLTGSYFSQARSTSNTLYTGDRAGSRYYSVLENTTSTESAQAWSGAIQPGFKSSTHAYVINPFVKVGGLELFGNFEKATGKTATEAVVREWRQNVYEAAYRLAHDKVYVVGRYNTAAGTLTGIANEVNVNRTQFGGGWFLTPNVLAKLEYVKQLYHKFPSTDIRRGGQFNGFMIEGVVAF